MRKADNDSAGQPFFPKESILPSVTLLNSLHKAAIQNVTFTVGTEAL